MKKKNNVEKQRKSDLVSKWQKLVVTYNKMREHPSVKAFWWCCIEFLKVCIHIALKKYLADLLERL